MAKTSICFASIIRANGKHYTLEIPDFNVTVKGNSYVEVVADGIEVLTALYSYRVERNIPVHVRETYESCEQKTRKERGTHFIYMLKPSAELM